MTAGDIEEPVLRGGDDNVVSLVGRVTHDAREMASAEIALAKARVGDTLNRYKNAIVFFAVAGVLALAALIALLVGLILSLSTLIGPGLATLGVIGTTLTIAGVLALMGKGHLTRKTQ